MRPEELWDCKALLAATRKCSVENDAAIFALLLHSCKAPKTAQADAFVLILLHRNCGLIFGENSIGSVAPTATNCGVRDNILHLYCSAYNSPLFALLELAIFKHACVSALLERTQACCFCPELVPRYYKCMCTSLLIELPNSRASNLDTVHFNLRRQ